MRGSYQTKRHMQIWSFLAKHPSQSYSAKEVFAAFQKDGTPVSLATIYRQLEQLTQDGQAKKIITSDGAGTRFQLATDDATPDAFYLKCDQCGALTQMNCKLLYEVADHMNMEHGFQLDAVKSVLYGRCQNCKP